MVEGEHILERRENKFFVPEPEALDFRSSWQNIALKLHFERESYPNSVNRTVYYFPGDVNSFFPGFSVRYRDYASQSFPSAGVESGHRGAYEIKCTDGSGGDKKKIRVPSGFRGTLSVTDLVLLIQESSAKDDTKQWFLHQLENQDLPDSRKIKPLAAVSYQRERYFSGGNVVSIDSNLEFFAVEEGKIADVPVFVKLGEYGGSICEIKEKVDEISPRWNLYRLLVKHDAERFYSKKGQVLNLLHGYNLTKLTPARLRKEIVGEEIEIKFDIENPMLATRLLSRLYEHFDDGERRVGFYVAPDDPVYSSQTTINSYFSSRDEAGAEQKMLLRLGSYKFTKKRHINNIENIYIREEDKGVYKAYTRAEARKDRGQYVFAGKIIRTRNSFWIYSRNSRAYKVSVDINRPVPFSVGGLFCQLEIEYTGRYGDKLSPAISARDEIVQEMLILKREVAKIMDEHHIGYTSGRRKVEIAGTI